MGLRIGGGIGPISVSTTVDEDDVIGFIGFAVYLGIAILLLGWPWFLSTYVAVKVFHADINGTTRNVVGWVFEGPWLVFCALVAILGTYVMIREWWDSL